MFFNNHPTLSTTVDPFGLIVNGTDWKLLQKQKQSLIQAVHYFENASLLKNSSNIRADLDGILNWIDFIQDLVADSPEGLGADKVFGISTL